MFYKFNALIYNVICNIGWQLYANLSTPHGPFKPCFFDAQTCLFCLRKFINPNFFNESGKTKKPIIFDGLSLLAETEGVEPSIQLPVYKLSRLARSTTLTSLLFILNQTFQLALPIAIGTTTLTFSFLFSIQNSSLLSR